MDSDLTTIPNIGPATARSLIAAGIPDAASLRRIGAHDAYRRLLTAGERPHFIGYYVLAMALQGRPWNDCRGAEKDALRARFDAVVAEIRAAPRHGGTLGIPACVESELDLIGLRRRTEPARTAPEGTDTTRIPSADAIRGIERPHRPR